MKLVLSITKGTKGDGNIFLMLLWDLCSGKTKQNKTRMLQSQEAAGAMSIGGVSTYKDDDDGMRGHRSPQTSA